jgi:hypothetical protein
MKQFSRRSVLSSVAAFPALAISARVHLTADKETPGRRLDNSNESLATFLIGFTPKSDRNSDFSRGR